MSSMPVNKCSWNFVVVTMTRVANGERWIRENYKSDSNANYLEERKGEEERGGN